MARPLRDIRPQHELLVALLRRDVSHIRRLQADSSAWRALVPLSESHQIVSLVASRLDDLPEARDAAPEQTRALLAAILRRATRLNFVLLEWASRCGANLTRDEIPVVILKGASLARTVYPAPAQRLFKDIDILVPGDKIDRSLEILQGNGLRLMATADQRRHMIERHFHYQLWGDGVVLELHWDLVRPNSPYDLPGVDVIRRSLPDERSELRHESLEDQLLHAAAQSLSEGFRGLLRVCDTAVILESRGDHLDWDLLARCAREGRLTSSLALLIRLAERLAGAARPRGAELLSPPRSVFLGLEPLQPSAVVLTRLPMRVKGYRELLRFWLLPGARGVVIRHYLFGSLPGRLPPTGPTDRQRPSILTRGGLVLRRAIGLLRLLGAQLAATLSGRRDHLSSSSPSYSSPSEPGKARTREPDEEERHGSPRRSSEPPAP